MKNFNHQYDSVEEDPVLRNAIVDLGKVSKVPPRCDKGVDDK